jgi:translation initiation factor 2A
LSGDIDIWEASSLQKVGSCKSNSAVSCLWAPDARRILTGVLNPRLRVDNCYKVFKYNGELLTTVDFTVTELYEVVWRPGKYTDRPITPVKKVEKKEEDAPKLFRPTGSSFANQLKAQKATKTAGRYLNPDEYFNNEANLEAIEQEAAPKKKKRIRKKKDRNAEENKDDDDEDDQ